MGATIVVRRHQPPGRSNSRLVRARATVCKEAVVGRRVIITTGVLVSADVAAELALFANAGRDRVRAVRGFRMSGTCEQVLAELLALTRAGAHVATATPQVVTATVPEGSACTVPSMTTAEFARLHNITTAAVTARCRRGTLAAEPIDGKWRIYPEQENA